MSDTSTLSAPTKAALPDGRRHQRPARTATAMPWWFFAIAMTYIVVLLFVFALYHVDEGFRDALPDRLGILPIGVPWFGALGGALISLTGTFMHSQNWQHAFDYWHYARPWVGAIAGSIGALILYVITNAATANATLVLDDLTFYVVAFVIGYREGTFRSLLENIVEVIVKPGQPDQSDLPDGVRRAP